MCAGDYRASEARERSRRARRAAELTRRRLVPALRRWCYVRLRSQDCAIAPVICPTCQIVVAGSRRPAAAGLLCMGLFSMFWVRAPRGRAAGLPGRIARVGGPTDEGLDPWSAEGSGRLQPRERIIPGRFGVIVLNQRKSPPRKRTKIARAINIIRVAQREMNI